MTTPQPECLTSQKTTMTSTSSRLRYVIYLLVSVYILTMIKVTRYNSISLYHDGDDDNDRQQQQHPRQLHHQQQHHQRILPPPNRLSLSSPSLSQKRMQQQQILFKRHYHPRSLHHSVSKPTANASQSTNSTTTTTNVGHANLFHLPVVPSTHSNRYRAIM